MLKFAYCRVICDIRTAYNVTSNNLPHTRSLIEDTVNEFLFFDRLAVSVSFMSDRVNAKVDLELHYPHMTFYKSRLWQYKSESRQRIQLPLFFVLTKEVAYW